MRGSIRGRCDGLDPTSFIFSSDGVDPWKPNWVTKKFIHIRCSAGLRHFRLHDLRHFMATQMLQANVPISIVSNRLAHARASTTLNVYAHAVPGGDAEAAAMIGRLVIAS